MDYEYLKDRYDALEYQYMKLSLMHNHVKSGIANFLKLIIDLRKSADTLQKADPHDPQAAFLLNLADQLTAIYDKDFKQAVTANSTNDPK